MERVCCYNIDRSEEAISDRVRTTATAPASSATLACWGFHDIHDHCVQLCGVSF